MAPDRDRPFLTEVARLFAPLAGVALALAMLMGLLSWVVWLPDIFTNERREFGRYDLGEGNYLLLHQQWTDDFYATVLELHQGDEVCRYFIDGDGNAQYSAKFQREGQSVTVTLKDYDPITVDLMAKSTFTRERLRYMECDAQSPYN